METAAAVDNISGPSNFVHSGLQNPAGFRTVSTGSAAINQQTTKPDRSLATKTGHFDLLPT